LFTDDWSFQLRFADPAVPSPRLDIPPPHCIIASIRTKQRREKKILRARNRPSVFSLSAVPWRTEVVMGGIIYLVGLIVIVMAILSVFGLR
jgi:hypothetical protein